MECSLWSQECEAYEAAPATARTLKEIGARYGLEACKPGLVFLRGWLVGRHCVEQAAAQHQFFGPVAVGHESVVADALESVGQNVQQEASDELGGLEAHGLVDVAGFVVLVGEGDRFATHLDEPVVGEGDAVGVPGQVGHVADVIGLRRSGKVA